MQRRRRSIHLSKETLRYLEPKQVRARLVGGAGGSDPSFLQSCFFNTCYDTCDWNFTRLEES